MGQVFEPLVCVDPEKANARQQEKQQTADAPNSENKEYKEYKDEIIDSVPPNLMKEAESFFNSKKVKAMYPFSPKYPWIIALDSNDKIDTMTYQVSGVEAVSFEPFSYLLSNKKKVSMNGVDHVIFEEYDASYCYGKIDFPLNITGITDNLYDNPAWKAVQSEDYEDVLPIYIGGTVGRALHSLRAVNCSFKLKSFHDKLVNKSMVVCVASVVDGIYPTGKTTRIASTEVKNMLLSKYDIVISSLYRIQFTASLGPSIALITCMNTYKYTDFVPNKASKLSYSSGGDQTKLRGLWHGLIYDKDIYTKNNKATSIFINFYPALGSDSNPMLAESLFIETMGNKINICRGLLLAQKLGFDVILCGQPLAIGQILYLYHHKFKEKWPKNIHIVCGGYLMSPILCKYINNMICNKNNININISWSFYYGTTDFMAACLGSFNNKNVDDINSNSFQPAVNNVIPFIFRDKLYLQKKELNDTTKTINSNDNAKLKNNKFIIEPANELEKWILYDWNDNIWHYLTGNAMIKNNTIYLQSRSDDHIINNVKFNKLPNNYTLFETLSFNHFQTTFNSDIFRMKPKYLYLASKEKDHKELRFLHWRL